MFDNAELQNFKKFLTFSVLGQIFALLNVMSHTSSGDTIFLSYSSRYLIIVILAISLTIAWICAALLPKQLLNVLQKINSGIKLAMIVFGALVVWISASFISEAEPIQWLWLNWGLVSILMIVSSKISFQIPYHSWLIACVVMTISIVLLKATTSVLDSPFYPDDAHWADLATAPFYNNTLAARTWLRSDINVEPGVGWSPVIVGKILMSTSFHPYTIRMYRIFVDAVGVICLAMLVKYLFNRQTAWIAALIASLSVLFFTDAGYRPNSQVLAISPLIILVFFKAKDRSGMASLLWYCCLGFMVTISMQLHAIALGLALGTSTLVLFDLVNAIRKSELRRYLPALVCYGGGALLGTIIYFVFNIMPVGGLESFLEILVSSRFTPERNWLRFVPNILEGSLMFAGAAAIFFQPTERNKRLFLIIITLTIMTLVVDTQNYIRHYWLLWLIPSAILIHTVPRTSRGLLIFSVVLFIFGAYSLQTEVSSKILKNIFDRGRIPEAEIITIGESILPYVSIDEKIVSTHELIWTFHAYPNFVSYGAELNLLRRTNIENPLMRWEAFAPDVVINLPQRMVMGPGLQLFVDTLSLCARFETAGNVIEIYRKSCGDSP